jgi:Tol biopolymer transport system component
MGLSTPVWVDREGSVETIPLPAARYGALALSPDGLQLAITVPGTRRDVRVYDFTPDSDLNPVTTLDYDIGQPLWSPDGRQLAFVAEVPVEDGTDPSTVFVQDIGGGDARRLLDEDPASLVIAQAWSSTGDIALAVQFVGEGTNIWMLPSGAREAQMFLDLPGDQWAGGFSPDGRWLAYHSDESGTQEVWVTDYPGGTTRRMLSTHAGEGKEPIWSPLGDEVFYRSDGSIYAVPVQADSTLTVGTPVELFRGPFVTVGGPEFDVAPDAQRFIMLREPPQPPATRIHLISNWFEELKQRVGN